MRGGNKSSLTHLRKPGTFSCRKLQVCLSMYDLFLPPCIKWFKHFSVKKLN